LRTSIAFDEWVVESFGLAKDADSGAGGADLEDVVTAE
jgi:hypothetical protein